MSYKPKQLLLLLFFLCVALVNVQAQEVNTSIDVKTSIVTGGIKSGVNLSYYIHKHIPNGISIPLPGAYFGGFINLDITHGFSIQGELLFNYKVRSEERRVGKEC